MPRSRSKSAKTPKRSEKNRPIKGKRLKRRSKKSASSNARRRRAENQTRRLTPTVPPTATLCATASPRCKRPGFRKLLYDTIVNGNFKNKGGIFLKR